MNTYYLIRTLDEDGWWYLERSEITGATEWTRKKSDAIRWVSAELAKIVANASNAAIIEIKE